MSNDKEPHSFITPEMKQQQIEKIEQLRKAYPNADWIDVWWDGESVFCSDKPRMKYKIIYKGVHE